MRLFVAVQLPEGVVEDLDDFLEVRRDSGGALRWSPPSQWHVTLAFMADAPDRVVEDVVGGVAAVAARTAPIRLSLNGGGCFPDVSRAKVLFAAVEGGDALTHLAHGIRSACAVAGAAPEGGPFRSHVTLARFPRPADATRWLRILDTHRGPAWRVEDVAVVASHLPRERGHRPRHEVLAHLPLGG